MSSLLILLLQFTGTAIGQRVLVLSVRVGDEATLPCNYVTHDQRGCESTTWLFSDAGNSVALVRRGQIGNHAKSDRLRVTEKCSLLVKKVTEEDAGLYTCRQFSSGEEQEGPDIQVYLSVVTMTGHQDNDEVTLRCSVKTYGDCGHTVKWLFQGRDVDKDHNDIRTSQSRCSASVTFPTSHFSYAPRSKFFTCSVKDGSNVQAFSLQSSGEDTAATTESYTRSGFTTTASVVTEYATGWWWWIIVVIVGVAALIIINTPVIGRTRTQGAL
nr:uncharacterized protein LOC117445785 [Pseudochaenichthys georgianus]